MEAGKRHDVADIERNTDKAEQDEVSEANDSRHHDLRIGAAYLLLGDGKRGLRQAASALDGRAIG